VVEVYEDVMSGAQTPQPGLARLMADAVAIEGRGAVVDWPGISSLGKSTHLTKAEAPSPLSCGVAALWKRCRERSSLKLQQRVQATSSNVDRSQAVEAGTAHATRRPPLEEQT